MSDLIKILVVILFMNFCLTLAGISLGGRGEFDVLGKFVSVHNDTVTPTQQFSLTNGSALPTDPNSAIGSQTNVDNGSFIDTLRLVFNFLLLLLIAIFLPIYWGFALALPVWLTLFLAIMTIIETIAWICVVRGVGS
jgi:hypothetical protein